VAPATLPIHTAIDKPVPFETLSEIVVHAVEGRTYIKRRTTEDEARKLRDLLPDLRDLYGIGGQPAGYVTTPVFPAGAAEPAGRDIVADSLDRCLWFALLAGTPAQIEAVRGELGGGAENRRRVLNVGVAPAVAMPPAFEDIGVRARIPHFWEICTGAGVGDEHLPLEVLSDGTGGLTRAGVVRLLLPGKDDMGAPVNDVLRQFQAGVGDRPPRIDDPLVAARIVTWLRLRPDPAARLASLRLSWAGINAVAIEQRRTLGRQVIGQGTGASDLELSLGRGSVEASSLAIEVEEEEGMRLWRQVPDTAAAGRDDRVYSLDPEAGTVRFGDGVRGMIPAAGRAIQVASLRAGGGAAGNLPPAGIKTIAAAGAPRLKVLQPLATVGGADAESLAAAEARIPASIRHGGRAVTVADYRELALRTPGVPIGRVEVLERFKPQQRRDDVPGVVSVMVIPQRLGTAAPAPRPDRPMLETVHDWLDQRRPLATELYVIGTDYVPMGVSAAVELIDSNQREAVLAAVADAIRLHLWPLPPGGPDGAGWPLGRAVDDRMIETAIGRVSGVRAVAPLRLFFRRPGETRWRPVAEDATGRGRLPLLRWQLPELAMLSVIEGDTASPTLPAGAPALTDDGIAVPVVPERC
ncbi:MAG: putative baseplate assembly protein, partial [Gemmatimonadetes bacterium]|nr:putative baseplate assembly protein [Gemmatimonadota bacterium]